MAHRGMLRNMFIAVDVTWTEIEVLPVKRITCVSRGCVTARAKRAAQQVVFFGKSGVEMGREYGVSEKQIRKDLKKVYDIVMSRRETVK